MKLANWNVAKPVAPGRRELLPAHIAKIRADVLVLTETHVFPLFAARNRLKQLRGRALVDWQAPMLLSRLQRALNFCGGVIRK